jgi:hypothetical protein
MTLWSNRRISADAHIEQRCYLNTRLIKSLSQCPLWLKMKSTKNILLCKTNPISKMQNAHNNLLNKNLQLPVCPPPPKNKPNQNQFSKEILEHRGRGPSPYILQIYPLLFPNLSHFITHFPPFPFHFYILFTLFITIYLSITYENQLRNIFIFSLKINIVTEFTNPL